MSQPTDAPPMPQPGPEHQRLMDHVGTWDVECLFFTDPSADPVRCAAVETVERFGPFYTLSHFDAPDMMGMPFQGRGIRGYSPAARHYDSTWIDTLTPDLFHFTGRYEDDVLVLHAKAPDPMSQVLTTWRSTERWIDADTRHFEMFMKIPTSGQEIQVMSYTSRRRR